MRKLTNSESSKTFRRFIDSTPEEELLILKKKYDESFIKYWTSGDNPPKFQPISLNEFRKRLKQLWFYKKYG